MKLSPFPRHSVAAGANAISTTFENPFSCIPSGSLALICGKLGMLVGVEGLIS